MADTLCPACGLRVDNFSEHINTLHTNIIPHIPHSVDLPTPEIEVRIKPARVTVTKHAIASAFRCDQCGTQVRTIDSRKVDEYVLRRKYCPECENRFSTYEVRLS